MMVANVANGIRPLSGVLDFQVFARGRGERVIKQYPGVRYGIAEEAVQGSLSHSAHISHLLHSPVSIS